MSFDLSELTESQRLAAQHKDGPLLILAGPGSGKTRVVTHRIANLLSTGVPSRHILALTFTNKAADEMRSRVDDLVPGESVWMSTFHRFCSRLLREHASMVGLAENFTIFDTSDSLRALNHAVDGLDELNLAQVTPAKLLYAISNCKNELITAAAYQPHSRDTVAVLLSEVYPAYQQQLTIANAVDFDDLLLHTVELLKNNEELRRELDERYRYIMVDEYQDTNLAQYAIVRALSIDYPNLAVTGDPDQSIYAWRGANIQNILGFERDYPDVTVVRLEQNFRSTPQILGVADDLIKYNTQRKKKSLLPVREEMEPVKLLAFPSQLDESRHIADDITQLVSSGQRDYKDFAIFYRINALSRYLEHTLRESNIPYQVLNGVEFYQRKEVKDILAYLQLINNPNNDVAFLRIINTPARGLGKVTISKLSDYARQQQIPLMDAAREFGSSLSKRAATSLRKFIEMMDDFQRLALFRVEEILGHVLSKSGYEDHVRASDERADEDRGDNIRELLTAARQFDMVHPGSDYLEAFLEQSSLVSDSDAWEDESNKVTLMTLHGSKGLEFPVVYMVALEQGKLPHERSLQDPVQLEEERRLMFVGITRAEDALTISYAKYRDYRGQLSPTVPSSFLMELPRSDLHVVAPDAAPVDEYSQEEEYPADWDEFDGMGAEAGNDDLADDAMDFDPSTFEDKSESNDSPVIQTAAAFAGEEPKAAAPEPKRADPNAFAQGMRVKHPEYGLGKVVALSGAGNSRTATVNFVTAGEKKFVLARSVLQPLT